MTRLVARLGLALSLCVTLGLACLTFQAVAQDKKDDKKDVKKDDKKEVKKDDKKDDKKKDDKKDDKKEEPKKEPFKPDTPAKEIKAHKYWVYVVQFADGKLVTAGRDRTIKVWNLDTGKDELTIKDLKADPQGMVLLDNGAKIAVSSWIPPVKKKIDIKDSKDTKDKKDDKDKAKDDKDKGNVKDKAQDDKDKGNIKDKGKEPKKDEPPPYSGEIRIYDAKSGKVLQSLIGHTDFIEALAATSDGKFLASASRDQTAKIWDLAQGKDVVTLKGHTQEVLGVAFDKDGSKIATASADGTVKIWDRSGKDLNTFKVERTVKVKDAKDPKKETEKKENAGPFRSVTFSPDGKYLAAGNTDGFVKIYEAASGKEVKDIAGVGGILALAFSPDGSKLATAGYDQIIKVWSIPDGKELNTIKAAMGSVLALRFSPNGQTLVSGDIDGLVKVWNPMKK